MKYTVIMSVFIIFVISISGCGKDDSKPQYVLNSIACAEGRSFYINKNGNWEKIFLKGVNMGAAKPGYFPGELAITKEEYKRWFGYISAMNADVIRVYTTLMPAFYDALYEYNSTAEKPMYIMQGVWINEEHIKITNDAFADGMDGTKLFNIRKDFISDAMNLVDVIHGNAVLPETPGFASGTYTRDVSRYVIGWILGIEWYPEFVHNTNANNPSKNYYSGIFLYAKSGASPFEIFLCEVGDIVITYEAEKYNIGRPLSFTNWVTTDPLRHSNEPDPAKEDAETVNVENIQNTGFFTPGMFASYHIYPYYPEFMNYQQEYTDTGDPYRAYLADLFSFHTLPVLVAEFGVPASRGIGHINLITGYDQGNNSESEQGTINANLLADIHDEGYCGALVFSWQDEWFKRTWNTMDFDDPDRRPYWSNPQTNEQEFGLLAFDPGTTASVCYVDGDVSEWNSDNVLYTGTGVTLKVKSDEKYVYILAETTGGFNFSTDTLYIPVDTIQTQGNSSYTAKSLTFARAIDFIIQINGTGNSKILVDAYYDSFYYFYHQDLGATMHPVNNSGDFNPMRLCLSAALTIPPSNTVVPFKSVETGTLFYGDGNPAHASFNSLADFCFSSDNTKAEIRVPWQLFNVMDPSSRKIIGYLDYNLASPVISSVSLADTEGFYFGAYIDGIGGLPVLVDGLYTWSVWHMSSSGWNMPTYHERLKPSYYILQEAFSGLTPY